VAPVGPAESASSTRMASNLALRPALTAAAADLHAEISYIISIQE
jgi:hypothetical protein